jgi:hypothetical protein
MNIHQRGKRQEARGEIRMKDAACDPRPGNEQGDSSRDQRQQIP